MRRAHKPTNPQVGKYTGDNFVIAPASMLPFKQHWLRLATTLPDGEVLFVVPDDETPLRQTMRRIVPVLRARGRTVTAVTFTG